MSLSELLLPQIGSKPWMNTYHNSVHTLGFQVGTSSTQGFVLGAIDTNGNVGFIPASGTGGVGGVTNTDVSIAVTSTASGGASVQATGNFSGAGETVKSQFSPLSNGGLVLITGSTGLSPSQVLGGAIDCTNTTPATLALPNGVGANSLDSTLPSTYAVNGSGFLWLVSATSSGTVTFSNNASFQMSGPPTIAAGASRIFYVVRSAGNWVAL